MKNVKNLINKQVILNEEAVGTVKAQKVIDTFNKLKTEMTKIIDIKISKFANGEKFYFVKDNVEFSTQYVIDKFTVRLYTGVFGTPNEGI